MMSLIATPSLHPSRLPLMAPSHRTTSPFVKIKLNGPLDALLPSSMSNSSSAARAGGFERIPMMTAMTHDSIALPMSPPPASLPGQPLRSAGARPARATRSAPIQTSASPSPCRAGEHHKTGGDQQQRGWLGGVAVYHECVESLSSLKDIDRHI